MRNLFLTTIIATLLSAVAAQANDPIALFDLSGVPVEDYTIKVELAAQNPGTIFEFSDGKQFMTLGELRTGFNTLVLKVQQISPTVESKPIALRLPRGFGYYDGDPELRTYESYFEGFVAGYSDLHQTGVSIPEMKGHLAGQYTAMEWVETEYDLMEFMATPEKFGDPAILAAAETALFEWARSSRAWASLSDFRPIQLRYSVTLKRWFLMDWDRYNTRWTQRMPAEKLLKVGDWTQAT